MPPMARYLGCLVPPPAWLEDGNTQDAGRQRPERPRLLRIDTCKMMARQGWKAGVDLLTEGPCVRRHSRRTGACVGERTSLVTGFLVTGNSVSLSLLGAISL